MKKFRYLQIFAITFCSLFFFEIVFRILSAQNIALIDILRSLLFVASFSVALTTLLYFVPDKPLRITLTIILTFFCFYILFQTGIKRYYGQYFSIRFITQGMPAVGSYAFDFIKYLKFEYLLFPAALALSLFWLFKTNFQERKQPKRTLIISLVAAILLQTGAIGSLFLAENPLQFESSYNLYKLPLYSEQAIYQLGITRFLFSDFTLLWKDTTTAPDEEDPIVTPEPEPDPEDDLARIFDDEAWIAAMEAEGNASIKAIDQYLLSRPITAKNEMTGLLEGKNVIYILVEAFDYIGISETLTPTLYKMQTEGWFFNNHYSIQYNCATGESELDSQTSLYPALGKCSFSAFGATNTFDQTLYKLFSEAGYSTSSYHNWNDEFYERSKILPNLGSQVYYDEASLIGSYIKGWQSDLTMVENAWPLLDSMSKPFFAQFISSSMHLPYDEASALGDRYLSEVNNIYPNAPIEVKRYISKTMEFDRSMAYLLEQLESSGQLEDTVIVLYGDHRPLKFESSYLLDYTTQVDRETNNNLDLTPMFIYNPTLTATTNSTLMSNMDLAPTIANLFDLDYDPRLFMGNDIFDQSGIIVWQSGSWQDDVGYFSTQDNTFTPHNLSVTYIDEEIVAINKRVKNLMYYGSQIYENDYFKYRDTGISLNN